MICVSAYILWYVSDCMHDLLWFYGTSTIVGYLIPDLVYMICKHKSTELSSSKYCYVLLTIQFSIGHYFALSLMSNSSIWLIDRTLPGTTTLSQSGPWSDGKEEVLRSPQSSSITGASPSDCLMSYPGHSLGRGSYPSAEMQSVYSTTPANWTAECMHIMVCAWLCAYVNILLCVCVCVCILWFVCERVFIIEFLKFCVNTHARLRKKKINF